MQGTGIKQINSEKDFAQGHACVGEEAGSEQEKCWLGYVTVLLLCAVEKIDLRKNRKERLEKDLRKNGRERLEK